MTSRYRRLSSTELVWQVKLHGSDFVSITEIKIRSECDDYAYIGFLARVRTNVNIPVVLVKVGPTLEDESADLENRTISVKGPIASYLHPCFQWLREYHTIT